MSKSPQPQVVQGERRIEDYIGVGVGGAILNKKFTYAVLEELGDENKRQLIASLVGLGLVDEGWEVGESVYRNSMNGRGSWGGLCGVGLG